MQRFALRQRNSQSAAPRSEPDVGNSAFAHKGDIHVSAIQRNRRTYEHAEPEQVAESSPRPGFGPIRPKQHPLQSGGIVCSHHQRPGDKLKAGRAAQGDGAPGAPTRGSGWLVEVLIKFARHADSASAAATGHRRQVTGSRDAARAVLKINERRVIEEHMRLEGRPC